MKIPQRGPARTRPKPALPAGLLGAVLAAGWLVALSPAVVAPAELRAQVPEVRVEGTAVSHLLAKDARPPFRVNGDPRPLAFGWYPTGGGFSPLCPENPCRCLDRISMVLDGAIVPCGEHARILSELEQDGIRSIRFYRGHLAAKMYGTRAANPGIVVIEARPTAPRGGSATPPGNPAAAPRR